MARSMFDALMDEEKRGTLANPGSASPLGPTIPMRIGATLNPMLERVQDIFPKDNPYGSFIERLIVGDSPERTGRMAQGIPHQYTGAGPMDPIIRPQIVDLAGALPIGSAATLAKAAVPFVKAAAVPTAMATGAGLLGRALKGKNYAPTSTDDLGAALLGQSLQNTGKLDDAMVAYQGSPHKFDALDPSKIGTGQGAQTYGHGLYVAENKGVGQRYADELGSFDRVTGGADTAPSIATNLADELGDGLFDVLDSLRASKYTDDYGIHHVMDDGSEIIEIGNQGAWDAVSAPLNKYLYEIDVPDEDIAKMLDWDAPLSEQTESVRKALENTPAAQRLNKMDADAREAFGDTYTDDWVTETSAGRLYREMADELGAAGASKAMQDAGIPGIKYYDQGSRAAGDGTRNMVLFDDLARRAKVLKRNDEIIEQPSVDEFIGKLLED